MKRLLTGLAQDVAITRMMYSEKEGVLLHGGSSAFDRARLCLSNKTARCATEREWRIFIEQKGRVEYDDSATVTKIFLGSGVSDQDEVRVRIAARALNIQVIKMDVATYSLDFKTLQPAVRRKPKTVPRQ